MYKFTPLDDHLPSPLGASVWQRAKDSPSKQWFQSTITKSYQRLSPSGQLVEKNKVGRFLQGATSCDKQAFSSNEPVYVWNSLKHIWELGKVFNLPKPSREPRTCIVEIKANFTSEQGDICHHESSRLPIQLLGRTLYTPPYQSFPKRHREWWSFSLQLKCKWLHTHVRQLPQHNLRYPR